MTTVPSDLQLYCSRHFSQHSNDSGMIQALDIFSIDLEQKQNNIMNILNKYVCWLIVWQSLKFTSMNIFIDIYYIWLL